MQAACTSCRSCGNRLSGGVNWWFQAEHQLGRLSGIGQYTGEGQSETQPSAPEAVKNCVADTLAYNSRFLLA